MRRTEGNTEQVLAFVRNSFSAEIRYYGKVVTNAQVVEEKRRYLGRWPQRRYQLKAETMRVQCDKPRATASCPGSWIKMSATRARTVRHPVPRPTNCGWCLPSPDRRSLKREGVHWHDAENTALFAGDCDSRVNRT
ncbi:hypothetical protein [Pseudorhodoplanes sp.]|uniref:hypothetical protein n=1 Tax=Pseudorhodoplanes sp. TaxID=1934341 RepID=UPI002C40BC53|nr:hypothetical protein [Pseudorhodoplanes sp.]HWV54544.1 hypothetical protein [Pseudorhodoplanes sp.]